MRARACNCSGNDKADSVATSEVQRDTKTENEREGKASFYGALNSDEVARPIYRRGGEGDPNYPGTDKQTADEVGRNIGEGRKGKTGRGDISKEIVAMFCDREEGARIKGGTEKE